MSDRTGNVDSSCGFQQAKNKLVLSVAASLVSKGNRAAGRAGFQQNLEPILLE
jgi:hypothetical protein